jgi:hypothetical protein
MAHQYVDRIVNLKPHILADSGLVAKMGSAICHHYYDKPLDEGVIRIGGGQVHTVYGVGSVQIPEQNLITPVGVKLFQHPRALDWSTIGANHFVHDLASLAEAYHHGEVKVAYFSGIITWKAKAPEDGLEITYCAMITEDLSDLKKHLIGDIPGGRVKRMNPDRSIEEFLVDPPELSDEFDGTLFFEDRARIDLPFTF